MNPKELFGASELNCSSSSLPKRFCYLLTNKVMSSSTVWGTVKFCISTSGLIDLLWGLGNTFSTFFLAFLERGLFYVCYVSLPSTDKTFSLTF